MTLRGRISLSFPRTPVPGGTPPTARWWWLLVALAPVYLVLAAVLPPADDELYYWCWAKTLQLSYYDHPPMVAFLIRASTALFGDSLFAVRLPAALASLVVVGVIGYLTRPRTLLPLIAVTPLFTFGAVLVTPDTPLLLFWSLYALWLVKAHERLTPAAGEPPARLPLWLWVVGGVVLGCGILGKYTMGLGMMCGFVSFAAAAPVRRWAVGYAVHGLVAFAVTLPILLHNVRHDFVPILYQWKHSMGSPEPGLKPFAGFVGVQILLFGTTPLYVFVWAWRRRGELLADPRLRVCFCLFALPLTFFLYKSTRGPLEGNWALACYVAAWPIAAAWYETVRASLLWRRLVVASFLAPALCVLLVGTHLALPLPLSILSARNDRITRQSAKVEMARDIRRVMADERLDVPVFVPDYQWTALLRTEGVDAHQLEGVTRPSHFTNGNTPVLRPADRDRITLLGEGFGPPAGVPGFGPPRVVRSFPLVVRGEEVTRFWLVEFVRAGR